MSRRFIYLFIEEEKRSGFLDEIIDEVEYNTNSFLFLKNRDIDNLLQYCKEMAEKKKLGISIIEVCLIFLCGKKREHKINRVNASRNFVICSLSLYVIRKCQNIK